MVSEGFTCVHVGEMHIEDGHVTGTEGIADSDGCVGIGGEVDDDPAGFGAGLVNQFHQCAFVVSLFEHQFNIGASLP